MRTRLIALLLTAAAALTGGPATAEVLDPTEVWQAWSASARLHVYPQSLEPVGIELRHRGRRMPDGSRIEFDDRELGTLTFLAPNGNFEGFLDGRLVLDAGLELSHGANTVEVDQLLVQPDPDDPLALHLLDDQGRLLFTARQVHVYTRPEAERLIMERMDVHIAPTLAKALGLPEWQGRFVGELALQARLFIPAGASTRVRGGACADRPNWSTEGHELDVMLTDMGSVQDRGTVSVDGKTFEILTPSSSLANRDDLSTADVPWFTKFSGTFPPHGNDQHPYLVWNLYRIADGRLEQIGVSGLKHAFLTINFNCTINCGSGGVSGGNGHILWPGCRDVYGVGNNDAPGDLGPRGGVNPRTGVFVSRGSFFDQNADGNQDNSSSAPGENRMMVERGDLETPDAEYLFESWYVIRDDVDIFNSMGFRPVTPNNPSGDNWTYGLGPFEQGAAVDQWAEPGGTPESGAMNAQFQDSGIGRFKVLARVEALPDERWRYSYFVMNYDVERGIDGFAVLADTPVDNAYFHDPDPDGVNDWPLATDDGLRFNAPAGNPLGWGIGYSFGFDADQPPVAREVEIRLGTDAPTDSVTLDLLGPDRGIVIFADGFENAP